MLGITHRDINPSNILYGEDGQIRIIDFGLAIDSQSKLHDKVGQELFMAPEVLNGEYSHKCDIWSLGCILYMMIYGKHPFKAKSREELYSKIRRCDYQRQSNGSEELRDLIERMLRVDPSKRPTAKELWSHLWFIKCELKNHKVEV